MEDSLIQVSRSFSRHARGSLYELETQTELAIQLGFAEAAPGKDALDLIHEVARMLNGLLAKIRIPETATAPIASR